jgi:hypothetical protein
MAEFREGGSVLSEKVFRTAILNQVVDARLFDTRNPETQIGQRSQSTVLPTARKSQIFAPKLGE